MLNGQSSGQTESVVTGRIEKKNTDKIPLSTKVVGWIFLSPVLIVIGVALWAICWKTGRFLVEWALR